MKLRWTDCGDKLITLNGSVPYRIRKFYSEYRPSAGLDWLKKCDTQLEAIKVCQDYEDELDKKKE